MISVTGTPVGKAASPFKVSVVIPTYNRAHYLTDCLESVLCQDHDIGGIEIIVVDDGSTDNTSEILEKYGSKVRRFMHPRSRGAAAARNTGMKQATGEYVSFLDSDDIYYPYKCRLQAEVLDARPDLGLVYSEMSAFDDHGWQEERYLKGYHQCYTKNNLTYASIFTEQMTLGALGISIPGFHEIRLYTGDIFSAYVRNLIVFTNSIMVRRTVLNEVGFQDEKIVFEDMEFALRLTKRCPVGFIDLPTYKLRYHDNQMDRATGADGLGKMIKKQGDLIRIVERHALQDAIYYSKNKGLVDQRLAILYKYLAVPQMTSRAHSGAETRHSLQKCREFGGREPLLEMVTFLPYLMRRVVMKALRSAHYL